MRRNPIENPLQILGSNASIKLQNREIGSIPNVTFFYFTNQTFETLDEEILEWISRNNPSHSFLYDEDEDVYSLDDGFPV